MNIFYLDHNPTICVQYYNDKHVVKQILETAMMLCTAHRLLDGEKINKNYKLFDSSLEKTLYKASWINHPCSKWIRESSENYLWTYNLFLQLGYEYTLRYKKVHKCIVVLGSLLKNLPKNIKVGLFTQPYKAMPSDCILETSIDSYRLYYKNYKSQESKWTWSFPRSKPSWC